MGRRRRRIIFLGPFSGSLCIVQAVHFLDQRYKYGDVYLPVEFSSRSSAGPQTLANTREFHSADAKHGLSSKRTPVNKSSFVQKIGDRDDAIWHVRDDPYRHRRPATLPKWLIREDYQDRRIPPAPILEDTSKDWWFFPEWLSASRADSYSSSPSQKESALWVQFSRPDPPRQKGAAFLQQQRKPQRRPSNSRTSNSVHDQRVRHSSSEQFVNDLSIDPGTRRDPEAPPTTRPESERASAIRTVLLHML